MEPSGVAKKKHQHLHEHHHQHHLAFWALINPHDCTETDSYSLIERTNVGPSSDRDHSGSAALLEADTASEEDASGLAADGQEEGKDKGKGMTKLRSVGPSRVRAQTKLTPVPTDGLLLRIIARGTALPFGVSLVSSPLSKFMFARSPVPSK